jgi:FkbM family methyltransferase
MIKRLTERAEGLLRRYRETVSLGFPARRVLSREWRCAIGEIGPGLLPIQVRRPGGIIVDVGANIGNWASACLRVLQPESLICFEPSPTSASRLRSRFSECPNVDVRECAIGDTEGEVRLEVWSQSELNTIRSMGERGKTLHGLPHNEVPQHVPVRKSTLDAQLSRVGRVRLLKVDVQGAESDVIDGARETLRRTDCVVIEVLLVAGGYYSGATSAVQLLSKIEGGSSLRLSALYAPAMDSSAQGVWANAVLVDAERI